MAHRLGKGLPWLLACAAPALAAVVTYSAMSVPQPMAANAAPAAQPVALPVQDATAASWATARAVAVRPVTTDGAVSANRGCAGFTTNAEQLSRVAEVLLLPETGPVGRRVLRRTKVDYSAPGNGVTVLRSTGVCPAAVAGAGDPALCGLDAGSTIVPKPGAALTHWGAQFSAAALSLTVRRASDLRTGKPGTTWRSGARRSGFVGFCANAADPIVELRVGGRGIALTHVKHAFDPLGRAVDVGPNPTRETLALAADVTFERAIVALQVRERALLPTRTLIARYAPLLGLPTSTSYEALMAAVVRDRRYGERFALDLNAAMAPIRAETLRKVELERAVRDATHRRIGYTPKNRQWTDVISGDADMNAGVHSSATIAVPAFLGIESLLSSPLALEWIASPNPMEEIGEPATFCEGGGTDRKSVV